MLVQKTSWWSLFPSRSACSSLKLFAKSQHSRYCTQNSTCISRNQLKREYQSCSLRRGLSIKRLTSLSARTKLRVREVEMMLLESFALTKIRSGISYIITEKTPKTFTKCRWQALEMNTWVFNTNTCHALLVNFARRKSSYQPWTLQLVSPANGNL